MPARDDMGSGHPSQPARHARSPGRTPRLFVPDALTAGTAVALSHEHRHYLANVLRLYEGATVLLFNGQDGEWAADLEVLTRRAAIARPRECTRAQSAPQPLRLLFAPLKRARTECIVEKATELGCAAVQPVLTRRTRPEKLKQGRLEAIAVEAAEQCTLLSVPAIGEPVDLTIALASLTSLDVLIFCNEAAPPDTPIGALASLGRYAPLKSAEAPRHHVLIGPEGGFDDAERAAITACGARTLAISLGPRVMRADTAAIAALTLVSAVLGDWAQSA